MKTNNSFFAKVSILSFSAWILIFALLPFVMVLIASFMVRGENEFLVFTFTLENYTKIFDALYFDVFSKSFYLSFLTTLITLIVGFFFALFLSQLSSKYRAFLLLLMIIPFWTSSLVRTYALMVLLKTKGVLNGMLLWLGIISEPLEILYTDIAVIIGMVYTLLPFMILPLYAAFTKLDNRFLEVAVDLGASRFTVLYKVIIPLVMPGIIAGCALVFLPSLGMFFIPDLLGGANDLIIGNFIKNQFLTFRDWPFGSVASMILTLLMFGLILLYQLSIKYNTQKNKNEIF